MVKSHHLVDKVLDKNTEHPDLLVSDSTTRSLVHSILAESSHETIFHIVNHGLMQVSKLSVVTSINGCRRRFNRAENRSKDGDILLEVGMQLVEVGHTALHSLHQLPVSLLDVLFLVNGAVKLEELEV